MTSLGAEARVEKVIKDLVKSHSELMAGIRHIVVDYKLANEAPINAEALLNDIRIGRVGIIDAFDEVELDPEEDFDL